MGKTRKGKARLKPGEDYFVDMKGMMEMCDELCSTFEEEVAKTSKPKHQRRATPRSSKFRGLKDATEAACKNVQTFPQSSKIILQ
ncbi:hypothetical protein R1flu_023145 [Riccia fluitans]|uniref:Uncharacterized protein n=1 Tax=Riccia fluitans TaxID=41844 RepID=A0ABD1XR75_9MARC